jgi:hypothetical protein
MDAKHTPGPWVPVELKIGRKSFWIAISAEGKLRETEGNARLIAAAPDLLEALQACADALRLIRFDSDRDPMFAEAVKLTRAAISKALPSSETNQL